MTDKTEAQQRVQTYIDRRKQSRGLDKDHIHGFDAGDSSVATLLTSDLEVMLGEIQQLKAQLSARQAVPTNRILALEQEAHSIFNDPPSCTPQEVRDVIEWYAASVRVALSAAPPPPELEPHPPTRHCMCADCAPSFNGASDD